MSSPPDAFSARRAALMARIGRDAVALVPGAREGLRNADVAHPFRQTSDFFYLTGIEEPDALLALAPGRTEGEVVLWLRPRDPERERWAGARLGPEGAIARGADQAFSIDDLDEGLAQVLGRARRLFYALGENGALDERVIRLLRRFRGQTREPRRGPTEVHDVAELLHEQRIVKDAREQAALRRAVAVTADAMRAAARAVGPGVGEHVIRAEVERTLVAGGARHLSFETIVASGPNAVVMHYVGGQRIVGAGDLVLVDAGGELDYLAGDLTRTFPASGRFTPPQRAVYDIVAATLAEATSACRSGVTFQALHEAAVRRLTGGMIALGLLSGTADERIADGTYRRFFPHRLGHFLGMDVHDVGRHQDDGGWRPLVPGMVVTLEPGLYVAPDAPDVPPELRGIGVRIEDDVLVTASGAEVLSADLPRSADDVEALVLGA